jgi:D-alanyl-D-alanine carboxypeptidase/D-alanyl-D-alanine-endopeptidase (penicillin-binding protein 4)
MRLFKISILSACWLSALMLLGGCAAGRNRKPATPDPLILQVRNVLESRELKGTHWGIHVETEQGELLLDYNGEIRTVPASTMKLLTTATALVLLGPEYRIPTEFHADGTIDTAGILHGDLIIKGYGDPSLAALNQAEAIRLADQWSDTLKHLGLTSVEGCMWGDGTALDPAGCQLSWEVDDLNYIYGANVSALSIADNSLRISILPSQEQWSPAVVI